MKQNNLIIALAASLCLIAACNQKKQKMNDNKSSLDLTYMDTTINPKQDFYDYANGGWIKNNPLKDEYSRYGSFNKLDENTAEQIHSLIEGLSKTTQKSGSIGQKIADFYKVGMDTVRIEKEGIDPIGNDLKIIENLKDKEEIKMQMAELHKCGINAFFNTIVSPDEKNSDTNIVGFYQGGLGLGDRDYYLKDDQRSAEIRIEYTKHIDKIFQLAGYSSEIAQKYAKNIMSLETRLAKASFTRQELRDVKRNYNKITLSKLQTLSPAFNWNTYFNIIGIKNLKELNVSQLHFMKELSATFNARSVEELKAYLLWNVLNTSASYLNDALVKQNFEFYGKFLSGKKEMQPRWKRVVNTTNSALGEGVGEMYVEKYFPKESKERMLTLVANLQDALKERISGLDWMSDETKTKAFEKLATFHVKIGYPDKWKNYSTLDINANNSYWENVKRSNIFEFNYMINKAGKPVDKDEWLMNPQEVNAYYNPTTNEICFPAGILQPPFFFAKGDDALNYGGIGVVIGHEMTHGFDDQGREYDKDGNMKNWWTEKDAENFKKRADKLADYFNQIIVIDTVHANGKFTLGENIADQGGLVLSYAALQKALKQHPVGKIDGFTPEQRFFIAYANLWAENIREKEALRRIQEDVHSLGRQRVNATLPHLQQFINAFDIKEGDAMFLPADKRALVW